MRSFILVIFNYFQEVIISMNVFYHFCLYSWFFLVIIIIFLCFKAPWIMSKRPPSQWPDKGIVEFINYQARYRDDLGLALQDITFQTHGEEKVPYIFHKFDFPFYLNSFIVRSNCDMVLNVRWSLFKFHIKVINSCGWCVQKKVFLFKKSIFKLCILYYEV